MAEGQVLQIIGPSVDIRFPENQGPQLLNAIKINEKDWLYFFNSVIFISNNIF